MSRLVVVAGGGSSGHIFPGLAVVREMQSLGVGVHWLGVRGGPEQDLVGPRNVPMTLIDTGDGGPPGAARTVHAALGLPRVVLVAIRLLLRLDPVAVLAVGGYAGFVGLLAAGLVGIPAVLQVQNSIPGWSSRALSPWADLICCGFVDALDAFRSLPAEWTGNPVRSEFFAVADLEITDRRSVLVLGGAQGSLFLNRTLPRGLAPLRDSGLAPSICHETGVRWADVVRTAYRDLDLEAEVTATLGSPWESLEQADLVVARAGALTVSEIAAAGRPALLIPLPRTEGDQQVRNARSLERAGGAVVVTENEASPERLGRELEQLLGDPTRLVSMGRASRSMALPDSARRTAERVLAVGGAA